MIEQRTDAWHEARAGKVTGSVAGAILGHNPHMKPDDVMRQMVRAHFKYPKEFTGNVATQWGTDNEDKAKAQYEQERGVFVVDEGFVTHPDYSWLGASPDGLVGQVGCVEIKCPYGLRNEPNPLFKPTDTQKHYWVQMQIQMACTNRVWCDFVQWTPTAISIDRVRFDPTWFNENVSKLKAFYDEFLTIVEDEKLATTYLEDKVTQRDDAEWQSLVEDYLQAKEIAEAANTGLEEAKRALITASDGHKTEGLGVTVYPRQSSGTVKYAQAIKELLPDADLSKYKGKPSISWVVQFKGEK